MEWWEWKATVEMKKFSGSRVLGASGTRILVQETILYRYLLLFRKKTFNFPCSLCLISEKRFKSTPKMIHLKSNANVWVHKSDKKFRVLYFGLVWIRKKSTCVKVGIKWVIFFLTLNISYIDICRVNSYLDVVHCHLQNCNLSLHHIFLFFFI